MQGEAEKLFQRGIKSVHAGDTLAALAFLEKAFRMDDSPAVSSYLAYCIAKERGQVAKAIALCEDAVKKDPSNAVHYLNLGRIYLIDRKKTAAVDAFREGLKHEMNPHIIDELHRLGLRKPPVIPFLKRSNPVNKYLGLFLSRLRLR